MIHQFFQCLGIKFKHRFHVFSAVEPAEIFCQQQDIVPSLAQWGHHDLYRIDAIDQILPETVFIGQFSQRKIGAQINRISTGIGSLVPKPDHLPVL